MNRRHRRLVSRVGAIGAAVTMVGMGTTGLAKADTGADLGFTPITTNALSCGTGTGLPLFAASLGPTQLMQAFDPATPVNAPATSNSVGTENDMIALSPDGQFLYTVSENAASDGVTRLTLTGADVGKKELLAYDPVGGGAPIWSRVDGSKWYPYGGPGTHGSGVLLISEEFATGGIWQVNPDTGAFVRLDWLGNLAHEGVGLDSSGNLYIGDENRTGAIYKGVPTDTTDLTKGGTLYYMVGTGIDPTGWKAVSNPVNAITEASSGGAILFDRPEDFDERAGRVYFTVTEPQGDSDPRKGTYAPGGDATKNQVVNRGGVYSMNTLGAPDLAVLSGTAPYTKLAPMIEVQDPTYANQAAAQAQQGLQFPDNIAFDGRGHLWVHEDVPDSATSTFTTGVDVSKQVRNQQDELYVFVLNASGDGIVANPDSSGPGVSGGYKAADMQTSTPIAAGAGVPATYNSSHPCENEFSGGQFAADGVTLYVNQQHWANPTLKVRLADSLPPIVPESPYVVMLTLSALVGLGGGAAFIVRRQRHAAAS